MGEIKMNDEFEVILEWRSSRKSIVPEEKMTIN